MLLKLFIVKRMLNVKSFNFTIVLIFIYFKFFVFIYYIFQWLLSYLLFQFKISFEFIFAWLFDNKFLAVYWRYFIKLLWILISNINQIIIGLSESVILIWSLSQRMMILYRMVLKLIIKCNLTSIYFSFLGNFIICLTITRKPFYW